MVRILDSLRLTDAIRPRGIAVMHGRWMAVIVGSALSVLLLGACSDGDPPETRVLSAGERQQFETPLRLGAWDQPGSWPQFAHDPLHTGRSDVRFESDRLTRLWTFRPAVP